MVDRFPLVVVVVFDVYSTVNYRLHHVHEEEQGHHGEDKSGPVAR